LNIYKDKFDNLDLTIVANKFEQGSEYRLQILKKIGFSLS